jgi:hypothetical protein
MERVNIKDRWYDMPVLGLRARRTARPAALAIFALMTAGTGANQVKAGAITGS